MEDNFKDIFSVMINTMKMVEEMKNLRGSMKKQYVLKKIAMTFGLDDEFVEALGDLIELLLQIDKGNLHIKKVKKIISLCCI